MKKKTDKNGKEPLTLVRNCGVYGYYHGGKNNYMQFFRSGIN